MRYYFLVRNHHQFLRGGRGGGGVIGVERGRSLRCRAGVRARGRTVVCGEKDAELQRKLQFYFKEIPQNIETGESLFFVQYSAMQCAGWRNCSM